MHVNQKPGFYFHADANAFGGQLIHPLPRVIQARSSVSLAQAGGFGHAREERFELDGLISFESARATVSGVESHEDNGWRSVSTAAVEGLNILDVVTADRLVSQVTVTHFRDPSELPRISFNGTQFVNLRLNGQPVHPALDDYLLYAVPSEREQLSHVDRCEERATPAPRPTFDELVVRAEHILCKSKASRESADGPKGARFADSPRHANPTVKDEVLCSVVEDVTVAVPATKYRHAISVPDFGNIFLGEVRLTRNSAQVTMLRVELGCIASGQLSAASAFSNGRTAP